MINPQNMKKFFDLKAKASKDLEDQVQAELAIEDPSAEQAAAILNLEDTSSDPE